MAGENSHKIKLLKLVEMLQQETDEQHPMRATEVCRRLGDMGIACDRRTLSKDIKLLNKEGFEILSDMIGHEKGYYIEDRSFNVPELKILIDAVQAASFVTEKKTDELIGKIAALGGSHRADILKGNMVCFNTRKHSNESIYYNVNYLEDAIDRQQKAAFRYFDLDADGCKVYRKDGKHYSVEPIALVFNEDNYYLLSYNAKHDSTVNYRVDRMDSVEILDEYICEKALKLRGDVSGYTEQAFKMYGGRPEKITIQFDNRLIGAVYDRFGESTRMIQIGDSECAATVKVQLSPTFWGWIFQFGKLMRIISPASAIEEYKTTAMQLIDGEQ